MMNSNNQEKHVLRKCRICVVNKDPLYHLLSEVEHGDETFAFKDLMQSVANLKIPLTNCAPIGICCHCIQELLRAYSFVDSIRDAEKYWSEFQPISKDFVENVKIFENKILDQQEQEQQLENDEQELAITLDKMPVLRDPLENVEIFENKSLNQQEQQLKNEKQELAITLEEMPVSKDPLENVKIFENKSLDQPQLENDEQELYSTLEEMLCDDAEETVLETAMAVYKDISNSVTIEIVQAEVVDDGDDTFDVNELIEVDYSMLAEEAVLQEEEPKTPPVVTGIEKKEMKERLSMKHRTRCDYCEMRTTKVKYEFHLMFFHKDIHQKNIAEAKMENRLYSCQHCSMEFTMGICYQEHLRVHHKFEENEIYFSCTRCKRRFKKEHNFQLHVQYCDQVPTAICEFEDDEDSCDELLMPLKEDNIEDINENSNNAADPIAIIENDSESDSDYWAPYWSENAAINAKIVKSAETANEENRQIFPCTNCPKMFVRKWNLRKHLREQHNVKVSKQEGTFACSHCPREFPFLHRLEAHQNKSHKDIYPSNIDFKTIYRRSLCHYCGQMVRAIKQHIWRHEDYKPYKCQYCDFSFVAKTSLDDHERIHTGEKPYKCEVCDKSFRKLTFKLLHMHVHTNEKPYKCKLCDKSFRLVVRLKSHINTQHTGERPYTCIVCDKSFTSHVRLHVHRKKLKHWDTSGADKFEKVRVGNNRYRWKS